MRWTSIRKAELLEDIRMGRITLEQAIARYATSADEIDSWRGLLHHAGHKALKATHLQFYRVARRPFRRGKA